MASAATDTVPNERMAERLTTGTAGFCNVFLHVDDASMKNASRSACRGRAAAPGSSGCQSLFPAPGGVIGPLRKLSDLSVNRTGATRTKSVDGTRTIAALAAARAAQLIRESPTLRVEAAWPAECFRPSADEVPSGNHR